jgi:hypothetical protein
MDYYLYSTPTYSSLGTNVDAGVGIWGIIALILAVIGGILTYFLFVKAKTDPKNKFLKWLKNFLAFKIMWLEIILKILYYTLTIFCILMSFSLISTSFIAFLVTLVVGPILIRFIYEFSMMFVMIWRNTADISKNTEKK